MVTFPPARYCFWVLLLSSLILSATAQVAVTTQHNDNSRTGQNLSETILKASNVSPSTFGKLFSRQVSGQIYAQPLYVPNLNIGGLNRNIVYVATEGNNVYAFDADDPSALAPLWQVNLGTPVPGTDGTHGCALPQIGITSTPVIDLASSTIYVVAKTKDISTNIYHFTLHALDLVTGGEKFGGPVAISGQVPGTCSGSVGGNVPFKELLEHNRPCLLLQNGVVYIAFGSLCETSPWHGWLFGYSASSLQQVMIYNTTANGSSGGIWGGGQGLLGDSSNIYFTTGNGTFDTNWTIVDFGDSVVKLNPSQAPLTPPTVVDYFTPYNQSQLNALDLDIGSGGPMMLPGTGLIVGAGKDAILRLVDTANMGHYDPNSNHDVQEFKATAGMFMGAPVYWNTPNGGPVIYLWSGSDYLKAYRFIGGKFQTTPVSKSSMRAPTGHDNTSPLSLSANGSKPGTGILWASGAAAGDAGVTVGGIMRAFDASNLSNELWDSQQNASRDCVGNYAKFTPPTIANGKVYLATFSSQILVYGLNPPPAPNIGFVQVNAATPQSPTASVSVSYTSYESAGDLNVVVVGWNDTTSKIRSVTDSQGNLYSVAAATLGTSSGNPLSQAIYYAPCVAPGGTKVTVTFDQPAAYPDIRILEYSGVNTLDVTAGAAGNGTNADSGSATTKAGNELIFGAGTVFTAIGGPGSGFASRIITSPDGDIAEDETVNSTGSYNATASLKKSGNWIMQMATFR